MYVPAMETRFLPGAQPQPGPRPARPGPYLIRFPGVDEREDRDIEEGPDPSEWITVHSLYEQWILPQLGDRSRRTLTEHRHALNHWRRIIGDVDIREVNRQTLEELRDGLAPGRAPATVNKAWRTLRVIFSYAKDVGLIQRIPRIGIGMKCNLVKQPAKLQREPITEEEVNRLWHACSHATYPRSCWPTPALWRVALLLFYVYGTRTHDLFNLTWENVRFTERTIRFQAMKTRKLQALPLIDPVMRQLKAIAGRSKFVFPGFRTTGNTVTKKGADKIKRGYYSTWRHEIHAAAKIDPPVTLKHFRESMVCRMNRIEPGLGGWIAGHSVPGVTAMHYDLPTQRIWEALESTPLPECFSLDVI